MEEDGNVPNDGDNNQPGAVAVVDIQQQLLNMQNQNFAVMSTLTKLLAERDNTPNPHTTLAKNVKVPVGTYSMSLSEFRSFKKDVHDFKQL